MPERTEESAEAQAAVTADLRTVGRGLSIDELSPAGVLALQRSAGNRVARAAIANHATPSGAARRILARDKSLDDQVADLQAKIASAATVGDALKQEAKALATKCWSGSATDADAARAQVKKIVGALMNNKAQDTTEAAAKQELLDLALDMYSTKGIPKKYRSYYLAAGTGGAYDVRILDPAKNGLTPWKTVP
jgi:hypothetical protein